MLKRMKEIVLGRQVEDGSIADEPGSWVRDVDSSRRKITVKGLQSHTNMLPSCASTSDTTVKKSKALPEEESLSDEACLCEILARDPVPLDELRFISHRGCPAAHRYEVWCYLTGHLQPQKSCRMAVLTRKRQEYASYVQCSYESVDWDAAFRAQDAAAGVVTGVNGLGSSASLLCSAGCASATPLSLPSNSELMMLKQIRKDVPRMSAGVVYLNHRRVQLSMERSLYIWSLRHPACGYVQGMDDFIIPFISVVLANRFCKSKTVVELHSLNEEILDKLFSIDVVSEEEWLHTIEADTYWMVSYEINFSEFAFRWMNCLLLRELNATQSLRLWDTYLADEERDLCTVHVYTCAALLHWWSPSLCKAVDYSVALKFLQNLPTDELSERDLNAIISQSFVMRKVYHHTLSHLRKT
uniref:Conserved GTPase activating protein n=1 Tax=Trypanosoma vivax (strain Y486) TaxID=1055687 RepID=G0TWV2_TRYVY|nr:conserved GTPase activating protein, fragment [Trypanosoma vivax Y486]